MKRTRRTQGRSGLPLYLIGDLAEERFAIILDQLKAEGYVSNYIQSRRHGALDRKGIDFTVFTPEGIIYIQVKSSKKGISRHHKKYGTSIPVCYMDHKNVKSHVLKTIKRGPFLPDNR